jgi:hypothetical protein
MDWRLAISIQAGVAEAADRIDSFDVGRAAVTLRRELRYGEH